ncbi:MAG TPA: LysR family transcriptional regulator [Kiritimatiellia bacterium]|nr:LysR family transcriptional regulator [Kiritimatiellia bacterium]HRZ13511.1 LysR family transcriptional regulator [Kiritimatiellia bacterium]HSA19184.1 LysR family transcriptional regulator [Kiritimatiellia bacterium]
MTTKRHTLKKIFGQPEARPRLRLICATIGPGKAHLLQLIAETQSVSEAARRMGIGYKQAWQMVAEMNAVFRGPLVESISGGARGGGSRLSVDGRKVLVLYTSIQERCDTAAGREMRELYRLLKTGV